MIEKERKFELKYLPEGIGEAFNIKQGYLMFENNKHLRVRIINDEIAFLTFKTVLSNTTKIEYEYPIDLTDANEMFNSSEFTLTKKRYKTVFNGNSVDIDIFTCGLSWVEIEYVNDLIEIPPFCGVEITDNKKFSNIWIAKNGCNKAL